MTLAKRFSFLPVALCVMHSVTSANKSFEILLDYSFIYCVGQELPALFL